MPAQQTPDGETTSTEYASGNQPCTITPCEGIIWSGEEVPQLNSSIDFISAGLFLNKAFTANAVIRALLCVDVPSFVSA